MALSVNQLKNYCLWLESQLQGAQLQDVWTDGEILVMEFYLQRSSWLCIDLRSQNPDLAFLLKKPRIKKKPKPTTLFLSAHGKNLRLKEIKVDEARGRVVLFELSSLVAESPRECHCECFLIPKNVNFSVRADGKNIFWSKPRELPTQRISEVPPATTIEPDRDWQQYSLDWNQQFSPEDKISACALTGETRAPASSAAEENAKKVFIQQIEKKQKAVEGIQKQLAQNSVVRYFELGEHLKQSSIIPEHLKDLYDSRLSVAENRERCFQKAKSFRRKAEGTEKRLAELQKDIEQRGQALNEGNWQKQMISAKGSPAQAVLKKAQVKTRKLVLEENFEVVIGKSARDNIAILRQARPWDLWFHLRDYPGAHAILFREKNKNVPESVFVKVGEWLVKESLGKKQISAGIKYIAIVTECRFVKPVKGSAGLVTFQNERSFSFASK